MTADSPRCATAGPTRPTLATPIRRRIRWRRSSRSAIGRTRPTFATACGEAASSCSRRLTVGWLRLRGRERGPRYFSVCCRSILPVRNRVSAPASSPPPKTRAAELPRDGDRSGEPPYELPPFYRRFGYAEAGTRPFLDTERATGPCHFIVMTKALLSVHPIPGKSLNHATACFHAR